VEGNPVTDFLTRLAVRENILAKWNQLSVDEAIAQIQPCCGSKVWAQQLVMRRPFEDELALTAAADQIWRGLPGEDWMEAFLSHPRIGESRAARTLSQRSTNWSTQEQRNVSVADGAVKAVLARANREYERRFGHIFIVCASGRSATEIVEILQRRMQNDPETEVQEAAEQQRQITQIRLKKWLQG
jgi:2-oxo-4-hydroxy-4-carboxy-5-ureidoimidazoline decarboxylase